MKTMKRNSTLSVHLKISLGQELVLAKKTTNVAEYLKNNVIKIKYLISVLFYITWNT